MAPVGPRKRPNDAGRIAERLDALEATLGKAPERITADAAYGIGRVYTALEAREIDAIIPAAKVVRRVGAQGFPTDRFKYDPHHDVVRCPRKKRLTPRHRSKTGRWYRADRRNCASCPLSSSCLPKGAASRRVHITDHHPTILRARRRRRSWGQAEHALYTRHRWRVEGTHGTAKTLHGLSRAIRRGLQNMKIQALLTAIAMNLKKLATAALVRIVTFAKCRVLRRALAAA